jgi:hypothetical protein
MKTWIPNKNQWRAFRLLRFGMLVLFTAIPAQGWQIQRPPFGMPSPDTQQNLKPKTLTIRLEEGRITADIVEAPLQDVLAELAARTGIIFEIRSQENPLVSLHVNKTPIQETIERITSGSNTIFFNDKSAPGSEKINLVRVFPRTGNPPQPGILYLGTGSITKRGNEINNPEQALKVLAESTKIEEREKAIEVLVNSKSSEAAKTLMATMSDPAPEIRVASIEGLAVLTAHDALPGILKSLKDKNPAVRQSAATAVSLLGDAQNVKDLKPLSADKDSGVAAAADMAMRKLSAAVKK